MMTTNKLTTDEAITMLKQYVARWSAEHRNPDRRDLAVLVTKLAAWRPEAIDAIRAGFEDRQRYPERPMVDVGGEPGEGIPSVWFLGWRKGEWTPIHDHIESHAAILVLDHEVEERAYWPLHSQVAKGEHAAGGYDVVISRELHAGSTITVPSPYIHAVGNDQDATASTLHAYWPPLHAMHYYAQKGEVLVSAGQWPDSTP